MLPKSAFQTIAACMLYDSDMPKSDKLEILEFIEHASEQQLMHYLVHGECLSNEELSEFVITAGAVGSFILSSALISAASAMARAVYSKYNGAGAQACRDKEGMAKKACLKNFKVKGVSAKIAAYRKEMGKCGKTQRPDKCRKMFQNYIRTAEKQMRKIQTESYIN
jgi:hypothetical protein